MRRIAQALPFGPAAGRTVLSWDDLTRLADHLGRRPFSVWSEFPRGSSRPACAHRLPQRLDYVGLVAAIGQWTPLAIRPKLPVLRSQLCSWRALPSGAAGGKPTARHGPAPCSVLSPSGRCAGWRGMLSGPDQRKLLARIPQSFPFGASLAEAYAGGLRGALRRGRTLDREPRGALRREASATTVTSTRAGRECQRAA